MLLRTRCPSSVRTKLKGFYPTFAKASPIVSSKVLHVRKEHYFCLQGLCFDRVKVNTVLLGAQRSGTTSLHKFLGGHRDIHASWPVKEPALFFPADFRRNWLAKSGFVSSHERWVDCKTYVLMGYQGEGTVLESSTFNSWGTKSRKYELPQVMFRYNPAMRFVYLLRNPWHRIVSQFGCGKQWLRYGTINEFIERDESAILNSCYHFQLSEYLKFFSLERFHFLFSEEIWNRPEPLNSLFRFLGVAEARKGRLKLGHVNQSTGLGQVKPSQLRLSTDVYKTLRERLLKDRSDLENVLGRSKGSLWPSLEDDLGMALLDARP